MNAHDLLRKFILEIENSFYSARSESNLWKAEGLRRLYRYLLDLKDVI